MAQKQICYNLVTLTKKSMKKFEKFIETEYENHGSIWIADIKNCAVLSSPGIFIFIDKFEDFDDQKYMMDHINFKCYEYETFRKIPICVFCYDLEDEQYEELIKKKSGKYDIFFNKSKDINRAINYVESINIFNRKNISDMKSSFILNNVRELWESYSELYWEVPRLKDNQGFHKINPDRKIPTPDYKARQKIYLKLTENFMEKNDVDFKDYIDTMPDEGTFADDFALFVYQYIIDLGVDKFDDNIKTLGGVLDHLLRTAEYFEKITKENIPQMLLFVYIYYVLWDEKDMEDFENDYSDGDVNELFEYVLQSMCLFVNDETIIQPNDDIKLLLKNHLPDFMDFIKSMKKMKHFKKYIVKKLF